jgi:hypothetical protein
MKWAGGKINKNIHLDVLSWVRSSYDYPSSENRIGDPKRTALVLWTYLKYNKWMIKIQYLLLSSKY